MICVDHGGRADSLVDVDLFSLHRHISIPSSGKLSEASAKATVRCARYLAAFPRWTGKARWLRTDVMAVFSVGMW